MMLVFTIGFIFLILIISELWWRQRVAHDEFSRKFVHITVGSFVATWPFFLSWQSIELLSLAFIVAVGISKYFKIFQAIHSVQRPTLGELFFAASVGLAALITHSKWIYAAALLQMSLADGLAAVIGTRYGNRQKYLSFGHTKSVVGTLTFFVVSLLILIGFSHYSGMPIGPVQMAGLAGLVSVIENLAIGGWDNLFVPLTVALLLVNR